MPSIGFPELLVIAMILVLVFGASRLPQLGEGMGKAIRKFKRGLSQDDRIEARPVPPESKPRPSAPIADKASPKSVAHDDVTDAEIVDEG